MNAETLALIRAGVCPQCGGELRVHKDWTLRIVKYICALGYRERVFVPGVGYSWPPDAKHDRLTVWWEYMSDNGLVLVKGGKDEEAA